MFREHVQRNFVRHRGQQRGGDPSRHRCRVRPALGRQSCLRSSVGEQKLCTNFENHSST